MKKIKTHAAYPQLNQTNLGRPQEFETSAPMDYKVPIRDKKGLGVVKSATFSVQTQDLFKQQSARVVDINDMPGSPSIRLQRKEDARLAKARDNAG
jgi:hypothetical protein